jgi:hypothetical protein
MFTLFDYDASGQPIAERPTSQTPAQSLFWLNSPLVKYYADKFAERLLKMDRLNDKKRVEMAYLIAIGRAPSKEMTDRAIAYLAQCEESSVPPVPSPAVSPAKTRPSVGEGTGGTDPALSSRQQAWAKFCQMLFGSNAFRYVD